MVSITRSQDQKIQKYKSGTALTAYLIKIRIKEIKVILCFLFFARCFFRRICLQFFYNLLYFFNA